MLLVEAQYEKISIISKNCGIDILVVNALLSSTNENTLSFSLNETASSVVTNTSSSNVIQIKTRTLDSIINEFNFGEVDLLKLDVQGHELEVLKGSINLLKSVEFVLLEMTLMPISDHEPIFLEVLQFMDAVGFQLYDISSLIYKPYDKALYQIDGLFVKKDSKYINTIW
jgi:FkbM family methyltransferase